MPCREHCQLVCGSHVADESAAEEVPEGASECAARRHLAGVLVGGDRPRRQRSAERGEAAKESEGHAGADPEEDEVAGGWRGIRAAGSREGAPDVRKRCERDTCTFTDNCF